MVLNMVGFLICRLTIRLFWDYWLTDDVLWRRLEKVGFIGRKWVYGAFLTNLFKGEINEGMLFG